MEISKEDDLYLIVGKKALENYDKSLNLIENNPDFYKKEESYDIMLEPRNKDNVEIIMEFKVYDADDEKSLQDTVQAALDQIREKGYAQALISKGVAKTHIRSYGFAFQGKRVFIGGSGSE